MRGLKEIVFEADGGQPSKINTIGKAAFASCEGLECISLPEGLAAIGESAFEDCLALQDVVLPMSLEEIGRAAFRYCRNLRMVSTGNKISKVGDYAFYTGSQGDILVDTQSEAIKSHDWENDRRTPTFSSASYIAGKSVRAGLFGNGLLAFAGTGEMENWTEGTLPWKDALKRVKSVQIGQGITSLGEWMAAGSAITEVMMGDNVRAIGSRAFSGCSQLTYIEIGSGVKYIGANAFWAPNMLQTVLVTENETAKQYNWAGDNRQTAEGVEVYKISGSVAAHLKDGILTIRGYGETGDYGSYNIPWKDQEITSAIVMEGIERIGNNCFRGFGGITSIQLPDSLESIGEYAFYECASLVEVDFPENMDSLGRDAFYHCTSLVSADLENVKLNAIPYNAFEGCTSLRSIQIPSSVERVESGAFKDCTQVNKLVLAEGVSYLGAEAFGGCENIKSIMIPRSLRSVGASGENGPFGAGLVSASFAARTRSIADGLFRGCSLLEDVAMPRTVSEIGGNAFRGCISLEKLQMPDSLYSIGGYAFYGCEKLKEIAWEEDLQVVGEYAFYGCASLEKAPLPSQLRNLGRYAFYGCSGLTEVSFGKELKKIESYSFYGTNLKQVNLPYKISSIESLAFAGNTGLNTITIPANTTDIAGNALDGVTGTVVGGAAGSAAESFAQDQGYAFQDGIAAKQLTYKEEEVTMAVGARKLLELEVSPFHMTDQIVWESEDGEVATITVDEGDPAIAQVHAKGAGQTKIVAKAGSLTAVCTVNVGKYVTSITIDPSYANITEIPGNVQLEASVYPRDAENGELVWKSSNENVATVSQDGLVASVGNGMARITAATSDNTVRSSCFVKVNVYVPVERVDIFEQELLLTGKERKLEASVLPANATNQEVVWSSSDETVAVVDNQGIVTPVAEGTAEVKAEAKDGGQYGVCQVTVKYVETPVTGVTLDKNEITLAEVGASEQLTAKVQPENAEIQEVEWYSENEKVAEVDENGLVTAKGGGITNIVVKTKDGGYEASCQVTAQSLIEKITLSQTELKLEKGETAVLTATLTPYNVLDSSVEWYSTNTNIVTVDKKGLVTAVADGKAAVKCRSLDGTNITAVCQVAVGKREPAPITPAPPKPSAPVTPKPEKPVDTRPVKKKVSGVKLNKKKVSIRVGSSMTLKTTVLPSDASDRRVKWSTGNGKVASVSQKGVVKAKKAGRAAITVRSVSDPRKKAICTITVNPKEKVKLTSIQAGKKNLTVKWKKLKASGCQIQCSLNKKFSPKKAVMVKGGKTGKGKVTGLKAGKKYFVRVRVYQVEGGKKYYGPWSLVKSKKTK